MNLKLLAFPLIAFSSLYASKFEDQIDKFFDQYNMVKSTSSPELINSQLGTHFLGGGGEVRTNVYNVNPVHISLPTFKPGCGGIDYALGGINMASKNEIKQALKSIAMNGVGYAFLLGMETTSPMISSTMTKIQTWANNLNGISINSCEIATSLVNGAWPRSQGASDYVCRGMGTSNSLFSDHISARHGCRDDDVKRSQTLGQAKTGNPDSLISDYNVAWSALKNVSMNEDLKNLFMNVTGTIVGKGEQTAVFYPPQWKKAVEVLRYGGTLEKAYHIGKDEISVEVKPLTIRPQSAWKSKVQKILLSLQTKILDENKGGVTKLDDQERDLIQTTHFPIATLLSLMAQYNGKGGLLAVDRYSDLIALERVLRFAEEVSREALHRAEGMKVVQIDPSNLDTYIGQVNTVLREIQELNIENLQKISAEHQMIDYLMKVDKNLRRKERGI